MGNSISYKIVTRIGVILLAGGVLGILTYEPWEPTGDIGMDFTPFLFILAVIWGTSLIGIGISTADPSHSLLFGFSSMQRRMLLFGSVIIGVVPWVFLFSSEFVSIVLLFTGGLLITGAIISRLYDALLDGVKLSSV